MSTRKKFAQGHLDTFSFQHMQARVKEDAVSSDDTEGMEMDPAELPLSDEGGVGESGRKMSHSAGRRAVGGSAVKYSPSKLERHRLKKMKKLRHEERRRKREKVKDLQREEKLRRKRMRKLEEQQRMRANMDTYKSYPQEGSDAATSEATDVGEGIQELDEDEPFVPGRTLGHKNASVPLEAVASTLNIPYSVPHTPSKINAKVNVKKHVRTKKTPESPVKEKMKQMDKSGKRSLSGYVLYCEENRKRLKQQPQGLSTMETSRTLTEMWRNMPEKEKLLWKRRAKARAVEQGIETPDGRSGKFINTGKGGKVQLLKSGRDAVVKRALDPVVVVKRTASQKHSESLKAKLLTIQRTLSSTKLPGTEPMDAAVHLKLLGDSLILIGQKLRSHRGPMSVHGSLSVILDSFLCALTPLLCLTIQIPAITGASKESMEKTLDSVAYFMPGI